tara:strand:+ start:523 stop:858 length:336 start_codon:yes stop_codon:yes gene_type:complete
MNPEVNAALTKLTWSVRRHIHIERLVFKSTTLYPESQLPEHNQSRLHLDLGHSRRQIPPQKKTQNQREHFNRDQLARIGNSKTHKEVPKLLISRFGAVPAAPVKDRLITFT